MQLQRFECKEKLKIPHSVSFILVCVFFSRKNHRSEQEDERNERKMFSVFRWRVSKMYVQTKRIYCFCMFLIRLRKTVKIVQWKCLAHTNNCFIHICFVFTLFYLFLLYLRHRNENVIMSWITETLSLVNKYFCEYDAAFLLCQASLFLTFYCIVLWNGISVYVCVYI